MGIQLSRILRHIAMAPRRRVHRAFPPPTLAAIEQAIQRAEATHGGEIRFVVEGALDGWPLWQGQSARARAIDLFSLLRLWDTEHNNGVLIYLLLADQCVEIVADRGIDAKMAGPGWDSLCRSLEADFRRGAYEDGAIACIEAVARAIGQHFPARPGRGNELPDAPVLL